MSDGEFTEVVDVGAVCKLKVKEIWLGTKPKWTIIWIQGSIIKEYTIDPMIISSMIL